MNRSSGSAITRRTFVASLCSVPLAGCQDGGATVRFRVIAKVLYNGSQYEASTVMECRYARLKSSLVGMGGSTTLYGEALIFDLPKGLGTFYLLPRWRGEQGSLNQVYERGVLTTFGIRNSIGGLKDSDLELLSSVRGGRLSIFLAICRRSSSLRMKRSPNRSARSVAENLERFSPERSSSDLILRSRLIPSLTRSLNGFLGSTRGRRFLTATLRATSGPTVIYPLGS